MLKLNNIYLYAKRSHLMVLSYKDLLSIHGYLYFFVSHWKFLLYSDIIEIPLSKSYQKEMDVKHKVNLY